jgi:hypothetical protein
LLDSFSVRTISPSWNPGFMRLMDGSPGFDSVGAVGLKGGEAGGLAGGDASEDVSDSLFWLRPLRGRGYEP